MSEGIDGVMASRMLDLAVTVNGEPWSGSIRTEETLLEFLRDRLRLTGTKRSCESEVCGACTVLVDSRAVSSCTYLAFEAGGRDVLTIEGLETGGRLDAVQEAFLRHEGFQCGFCTSGMIMAAKALLLENPSPTRQDVGNYLRGNICRCGAYLGILNAVLDAATSGG
jgi:aerobic-type carbon monoxide dehydrogenase small subunit (CoxS/CutS family)